jgi:hypothetical protein
MLVLPDNIRILQKGDVKSDVGLRWQGLAGEQNADKFLKGWHLGFLRLGPT